MKTVKITHSPDSRRSRRIAERQWWQSAEIRAIGGVLIFLGVASYIQGSHLQEQGQRRDQQIAALSQALTSEQQNAKNNGETPVAPEPSSIVKNPEIIKIKGEKGDKGDPGSPGASGSPGKNGKDGEDGQNATLPPLDQLIGPSGPPGPSGAAGKDGKDGTDGKDGSPPTDWTFTITNQDGSTTTYTCKPKAEGSTSYTCDPEETSSPPPGETSTIGAKQ